MNSSCSAQLLSVEPGVDLFLTIENYTAPGGDPESLMLVHGFGESAEAWREWIPIVGGDLRVIRPDVRGFGRSTPMPAVFAWSMDLVVSDLKRVIEHAAGGSPVHLVGAKSGSWMAMKLAAENPELVSTLTVIGGAVRGGDTAKWRERVEQCGVRQWAEESMTGRFGTTLSDAALRWWVDLTARTPLTTMQSYLRWVPTVDISEDVAQIRSPTLVIAADDGKLRPLSETTAWQERIRDSELAVLPCDGWHVAGAKPRECARLALEFIMRRRLAT